MDLFDSTDNKETRLDLADASISYFPNFLTTERANHYYKTLESEINWRQDEITVYGKRYKQPRLTALYGESGKKYGYSNLVMSPLPFTPALFILKEQLEQIAKTSFNVVLLNLYRDGTDSNGWHSDDEKELGKNPSIASISLGGTRTFQLRKKSDIKIRYNLELSNGSLLLMTGSTQHFWQHQIPKTKKKVPPRINLTFRKII